MKQEVKQDFGSQVNEKSAIIWTNDYHDPETANRCKANAMAKGCSIIIVKNSVAWDWRETRKIEAVDYCYTNEPKIARAYTSQNIEIVDIDEVPELGATTVSDENAKLKAELAALKKAREDSKQTGKQAA